MKISIVIPLYKCSKSINELVSRIDKSLDENPYEVIFVNDCSPENDWSIVSDLSETNKNIKGINLSRNFGQHYAIFAGLSHVTGDWVVVMDGDLQDRPEEILKMYNFAQENRLDVVFGQRVCRQDTFLKRMSSKMFYKLFSYLTDTKQDSSIANFGVFKRKVIDVILTMNDQIKHFPAMVQWTGFNQGKLAIEHSQRKDGKSSYSVFKLFSLALNTIISFSNKPLMLTIKLGLAIVAISFCFGIYVIAGYFLGNITVLGYSSLIIAICFMSGIIISIMGVIGLYVGSVFDVVKKRPVFIIKNKLNIN